MSKDARNLSGFAKDHGIKTYWECWEAGRMFSEHMAIIEICKRIEILEDFSKKHVHNGSMPLDTILDKRS